MVVDDQHHREHPEGDAGKQRSIVQQQIGGTAAQLALVHEIQVAKDSIQRERNRQAQPGRAELLLRLRADRVKDVRDQSGRRDDGDHLIEKIRGILTENRPMTGGLIGQQHQFVPALGQRDEQREQNRTDKQPMADDDVEHHGARHRPHHEANGNRQHIDDDDMFQRT